MSNLFDTSHVVRISCCKENIKTLLADDYNKVFIFYFLFLPIFFMFPLSTLEDFMSAAEVGPLLKENPHKEKGFFSCPFNLLSQ